MELTFVTDLGDSFMVEIDPNMDLESVMALLEAEVRALLTSLLVYTERETHIVRHSSGRAKHLLRGPRAEQR